MSTDLAIRNARLIDPSNGLDTELDLLVSEGRIQAHTAHNSASAREELDASGMLVVPGLLDMHVHLREPGQTHKEDIASGTRAAVRGGFVAVGAMPNTAPAADSPEVISQIYQRAEQTASCAVLQFGCFTKNRGGTELVDFAALKAAGAVAFTDDGDGLSDDGLMREALEELKRLDMVAVQHCEDKRYPHGVMHLGEVSKKLGLPGMDPRSEEDMIERDIELAARTGAKYHVAHISTAKAVEMVRQARKSGVRVSAEVCAHHVTLTDEACAMSDPNTKMHPPLRERADVEACIEGVCDGTIELLVTDHAPHTADEKAAGMLKAPPGIVGLETSLALFAKALVEPGHFKWAQLVDAMSSAAARLYGLDYGTLNEGAAAHVTVIDPESDWTVDPLMFASRSRNTPFGGWSLSTEVTCCIIDGEIRYRNFATNC